MATRLFILMALLFAGAAVHAAETGFAPLGDVETFDPREPGEFDLEGRTPGPHHVWVTHYMEYVYLYEDTFFWAGDWPHESRLMGHIYATNFAAAPAKVRIQGLRSDGFIGYERDFLIEPGHSSQLMPHRSPEEHEGEGTWVVTSDRSVVLTGYAEIWENQRVWIPSTTSSMEAISNAVGKRDLTILEMDCSLADHELACQSATRESPWEAWIK